MMILRKETQRQLSAWLKTFFSKSKILARPKTRVAGNGSFCKSVLKPTTRLGSNADKKFTNRSKKREIDVRDWNGGHIFRSGTHVAIKAIPKQQAGGGTKPKLSIFDFSRLWRNYFGFCHHPNAKIHENTLKFHCPCSEQTRIWLSSQIPNTKQGMTEISNT